MLQLIFGGILALSGLIMLIARRRIGKEEYRKVNSKLKAYVGRHEPGEENLEKYAIEQVTFIGFALFMSGLIFIALHFT